MKTLSASCTTALANVVETKSTGVTVLSAEKGNRVEVRSLSLEPVAGLKPAIKGQTLEQKQRWVKESILEQASVDETRDDFKIVYNHEADCYAQSIDL